MIRFVIAASILSLVSGCTAIGSASKPQDVRLTKNSLVVTLTDASPCTADRPAGSVSWSGQLESCAIAWPYQVTLDDRSNILREIVEAIFVNAEDSGVLEAFGTVELTDPETGDVMRFVSPRPAG